MLDFLFMFRFFGWKEWIEWGEIRFRSVVLNVFRKFGL